MLTSNTKLKPYSFSQLHEGNADSSLEGGKAWEEEEEEEALIRGFISTNEDNNFNKESRARERRRGEGGEVADGGMRQSRPPFMVHNRMRQPNLVTEREGAMMEAYEECFGPEPTTFPPCES